MSLISPEDMQALNADVYERACIDREHLMKFLSLLPTNDGQVIIEEVKTWLEQLHNDPMYDKVVFRSGEIDAVLGDLDTYGRVQPLTIQQFKQRSVKAPPQT